MNHNKSQQGAVAIFVVIFCALFITIITVSFVGIMLKNQEQALNADLADSAYDSALAGVEDAKRLFLKYTEAECSPSDTTTPVCAAINSRPVTSQWSYCNSTLRGLYGGGVGDVDEVKIQSSDSSTSDQQLAQAYTCVKVDLGQDHYDIELKEESANVIPIQVDGDYTALKISWYKKGSSTIEDDYNTSLCDIVSPYTSLKFTSKNDWNGSCTPAAGERPPVVRAQFIRLDGGNFSLSDFDGVPSTRTGSVFLYPFTTGVPTANVSILGSSYSPQPTRCINPTPSDPKYACSANLTFLSPVSQNRTSYLVLSTIYKNTHVSLEVFNGPDKRNFTSIAGVDSTGRANDLFRRVKAQIKLSAGSVDDADFPTAALEVGGLCKNFAVTNVRADFYPEPEQC